MPPISPVVKNLIIINVVVYFATMAILGEPDRNVLGVFYPASELFQPFQLVTYMFMHANITHLLFNMYGLYMFGSALENRFGPKLFLAYYFITGFGALILYMLVKYLEINYLGNPSAAYGVMMGASGAVFGLMAGFGILFAEQTISLLFPPISMKAKYFVLIFGALELYLGVSGHQTGIAHFAHLGGALFGALLLIYWKSSGTLRW